MFSADLRQKAQELVDRYPVGRSALLPLLHLVQSQDGYVTDDGIAECAQLLSLTKAEVNAVATFYSMYKRAPLGRHLVSVCTNFACEVRGSREVYDRLHSRLGVGHNETTGDGVITLEHAECLGNCDGAPVVTVDYFNYECVTPDAAVELVDSLVAGHVPPPTRGYPSPGIRAVQHRLAGLGAAADDQPGASPGQVSADPQPPQPEAADGGAAERSGVEDLGPQSGSGGGDEHDAESPADARTQDQQT